jgi:hypothetical protein
MIIQGKKLSNTTLPNSERGEGGLSVWEFFPLTDEIIVLIKELLNNKSSSNCISSLILIKL